MNPWFRIGFTLMGWLSLVLFTVVEITGWMPQPRLTASGVFLAVAIGLFAMARTP